MIGKGLGILFAVSPWIIFNYFKTVFYKSIKTRKKVEYDVRERVRVYYLVLAISKKDTIKKEKVKIKDCKFIVGSRL